MTTLFSRLFGKAEEVNTEEHDIFYKFAHREELRLKDQQAKIARAEAYDDKMNREFVKEYKEKEAAKAKKEVTSDTKLEEGKYLEAAKASKQGEREVG